MPRLVALAIPGILLLILLATPSRAGTSNPDSYLIASPDGTRVLVMLGNPKDDRFPTAALPDGRIVNLRATFPSSGVYRAPTLTPIWQVGWYSLQGDLLYSDDFRHVVRVGRRAFPSRLALRFYSDGKLIRTYTCADLLTGLRSQHFLPYSTWDWHFRWYDDYELDPGHARLVLSTAPRELDLWRYFRISWRIDLGLQEFYTFDMATGSLLTRRTVGAWRVWVYVGAVIGIAATFLWTLRVLWRMWKTPTYRAGFPVIGTPTGQ